MLFNSYIFIFIFFPLVLLGYYSINHFKQYNLATAFLVCMSLWFYGYNNIYYLLLLVVSIILNTVLVESIDRSDNNSIKRVFMILGIILNLGILFYFKYYNFFIDNLNSVIKTSIPLIEVVLPLGISFYTFQQMSYVIDFYKGECPKYSVLEYAAYVTFFPQLIAGPIVYHSELIPQLRDIKNREINYENMARGLYAFACGLAKKVLIADTLSKIVNTGYMFVDDLNWISGFVVMVSYAFQIYFDFSGYSDMAYGIGYMFNIKLPVNFNSPYKAGSISDFWSRWHITLTRFLRKYVYFNLGGNRKGIVRTCINTMIVFLLSGLWHGANWTFIVWGALNGIGMIIDKLIGKYISKIPKVLRVLPTFLINAYLWCIFRVESYDMLQHFNKFIKRRSSARVLEQLYAAVENMVEIRVLERIGFSRISNIYPEFFVMAFIVILFIACVTMKNTQEKVEKMCFSTKELIITFSLIVWSVLSLSSVSEFLYFNF